MKDLEFLTKTFDVAFKFKVGERVRHKGDMKEHSYSSNDVGLLVLTRSLHQEMNNDSTTFQLSYQCRLIAFSGSGQIINCHEGELMTIEEWQRDAVNKDVEREMMRRDIKQMESDILKEFGLTKESRFNIKETDGTFDVTKEYRTTGFQTNKESGKYELFTRRVNTLEMNSPTVNVSDKNQIQVIPNENTPDHESKTI